MLPIFFFFFEFAHFWWFPIWLLYLVFLLVMINPFRAGVWGSACGTVFLIVHPATFHNSHLTAFVDICTWSPCHHFFPPPPISPHWTDALFMLSSFERWIKLFFSWFCTAGFKCENCLGNVCVTQDLRSRGRGAVEDIWGRPVIPATHSSLFVVLHWLTTGNDVKISQGPFCALCFRTTTLEGQWEIIWQKIVNYFIHRCLYITNRCSAPIFIGKKRTKKNVTSTKHTTMDGAGSSAIGIQQSTYAVTNQRLCF